MQRQLLERSRAVATLVDSSVWIGHFRKPDSRVRVLLESRDILIHSAVLGELAAGNLKNRSHILGDLKMIPRVAEIITDEVLEFIEIRRLFEKGLSWIDLHLLAS